MLTQPFPKRPAATWIAATGAFLLLAAATLFVAVRWDRLPDVAKLAVLGSLTATFLFAGRGLGRGFPATGGALFHLGAFLLPVDLAAANLGLGMGWRGLLLAEGLLGAVAFGWMASRSGSLVLAWAGRAGVAATCAGVAALSPVPGPLVLAGAGAVAHVAHRRGAAISWSTAAGVAPLWGVMASVVLEATGTTVGSGGLVELGLAGREQSLMAVLTGCVVAVVLGREAAAARDVGLVVVAGVSLATGGATTWVAADPGADLTVQALAGLFLGLEVTALLLRRDPFWLVPVRWTAGAAEAVSAPVAAAVASLVVYMPIRATSPSADVALTGDPGAALALGLTALAWLVAGLRRLPEQRPSWPWAAEALRHPFGVLGAVAAVATVETATGSLATTSVALVAVAGVLVAAKGEGAHGAAAFLAVSAPAVAWRRPGLAVAVAVVAATEMAVAAVGRSRLPGPSEVVVSHVLAALACLCAAQATVILGPEVGAGAALALAVGGLWVLAILLHGGSRSLGDVARVAVAVPVLVASGLDPGPAVGVAALAGGLFVVDALRLDRPVLGLGAAAAGQLVVLHGCRLAHLRPAEAGLVLCVSAAAWSGLGALAPARWRRPFLAAAGASVAGGLVLASAEPRMLAHALVLSGGLGIVAGVATRSALGHAGGAMAVVGVMSHLAQSDVSALEAYVLPVTAQLLVVGAQARARGVMSSWPAYGPAVVLLGGSALAERMAGGRGWHAVVAGAVGVAAVALGGWRRLAGPLVLGTGLVVTVTVVESLPALAGVPTWTWLAAGGTFLLLVGLALERGDTSPVAVSRRVVDVIGESFD